MSAPPAMPSITSNSEGVEYLVCQWLKPSGNAQSQIKVYTAEGLTRKAWPKEITL